MSKVLAPYKVPSADIGVHIRYHNPTVPFFPSGDLKGISIFVTSTGHLASIELCQPKYLAGGSDRKLYVFVASDKLATFTMFTEALQRWLTKHQQTHATECPVDLASRVVTFEQHVDERKGDGDLYSSMVDFWLATKSKWFLGTNLSTYSGIAMIASKYPTQLMCMVDYYANCKLVSNAGSSHIYWDYPVNKLYWGGILTDLEQIKKGQCHSTMDISTMYAGTGYLNPFFVHSEEPSHSEHPVFRSESAQSLLETLEQQRTVNIQPLLDRNEVTKGSFYQRWFDYPDYIRQMWRERDAINAWLDG
jgi:hypothetical protein